MPSDSLINVVNQTAEWFTNQFSSPPRYIAAAPGRVNLIGEHIDYNAGFVLPMAIDRYCIVAANVAIGGPPVANIFSAQSNDKVEINLAQPMRHSTAGHWSNYITGVLAGFAHRGVEIPSFQAAIHSMVPVGGGLSSSAAIEVATATLLEAITGTTLDPTAKALLCQRAEHEFAGVPCGIMDQFASVMGRADHLMLLDCRSQQIEYIPFTDADVTVLIMNSNVKHELSGGEYAARRRQCELAAQKLGVNVLRDITPAQLEVNCEKLDPVEFRPARHVVTEIERTTAAAAAIRAGDWLAVGQLMYASHDSLRDDFEVSCDELDLLVNLAREIGPAGGVIGSRMTGGGFGGCTVSLVETKQVNAVSQALAQSYQAQTGIELTAIVSRPARGAHVIN